MSQSGLKDTYFQRSIERVRFPRRYEEDYERLQAMNELLESEEAPLPQAALQQWLQKLDVGWNKLLEMWESRREVLVQAHIFHLFLRDVKQAESFLNNQVRKRKWPWLEINAGICFIYSTH